MDDRCADHVELTAAFGHGSGLIGVVSLPAASSPGRRAAILLNSGIVHHVGPNRLWVRLARRLAAAGMPALRFDLSAIGDSLPSSDPTPPPARWVAETRMAMDAMCERHGTKEFVLIGNCMGSSIGSLAAMDDDRVAALVSINPQVRGGWRYRARLMLRHPASWRRLLHGRGKLRAAPGGTLAIGVKPAFVSTPQALQGLRAIAGRGIDLLLVACEWDPSFDFLRVHAREFAALRTGRGRLETVVVPGSNHDFTPLAAQEALLRAVTHWSTDPAPEVAR